jgi:hypothetical protein
VPRHAVEGVQNGQVADSRRPQLLDQALPPLTLDA